MTTFCIGSKVVSVDSFKISSLPAKSGKDIYVYFWNESFSSKGFVSKRYKSLKEMYEELKTKTIIIFQIEVEE